MEQLPEDERLARLVAAVNDTPRNRAIAHAREALSYLKENYRIDSRVFRNRRAALEMVGLPIRELDLEYVYTPANFERRTLEALHEYAEACLEAAPPTTRLIDALRAFFSCRG